MFKESRRYIIGPSAITVITIALILIVILVNLGPILKGILGTLAFISTMLMFTYISVNYFNYIKNQKEDNNKS